MPGWCNGSHAGLRSQCRKASQFESGVGYHVCSARLYPSPYAAILREVPVVRSERNTIGSYLLS